MQKIAIVTDVYLPYQGGGQFYVWEIAKRLVNLGYEIDIITRKIKTGEVVSGGNENLFENKLKIIRLGSPSSWNNVFSRLLFIFLSSFYLLSHQYDLIDAQAFVSAVPGKIASILKGIPVILTVHGTNLDAGRAGILEKIILTRIKYNAIISVAKSFINHKNINNNIHIVHPGVDLNFYQPKASKKEVNRIIFVGRLVKEKGTELLLRIFDIYQNSNLKFVIIGDGKEKNRLLEYIKTHHIKNVELKPGMDKEELLNEYQKSEIFLLPSRFEGFPLTILEAESCGLSVVACDVGDVNVLVKNSENGYLCQKDDLQCLITGIKKLVEDQNLKDQISSNNRSHAQKYSWDETARQVAKEYSDLIK